MIKNNKKTLKDKLFAHYYILIPLLVVIILTIINCCQRDVGDEYDSYMAKKESIGIESDSPQTPQIPQTQQTEQAYILNFSDDYFVSVDRYYIFSMQELAYKFSSYYDKKPINKTDDTILESISKYFKTLI